MAEIQATPTKRKLDQVQNVALNPLNKKIKIDNSDEKKNIIALPDLPPEILDCIVSNITDDQTRRRARVVCQHWFNTIHYNEFRIGALLASEADEFYRIFNRIKTPINLKFMKIDYLNSIRPEWPKHRLISAPLLTNRICRQLTQLTGLDLRLNYYGLAEEHMHLQYLTTITPIMDSTQMTNLKRLKTSRIIIANQTMKFPPNLESLNVRQFSVQAQIFEVNTHLTELKISEVNIDLFMALPNLKKLKLIQNSYLYHKLQLFAQDLPFPNLEELETNFNVPDLSGLPNLTKLQIHQSAARLTPQLTKLKRIQCLGQIHFPENHQSLLQSLESCRVFSSSCNTTILHELNSQKITQLITTVTKTNYHKFVEFTNLVDLELTIDPTINPNPLLLPALTRICMQSDYQCNVNLVSNLTSLEQLVIYESNSNTADLLQIHGLSKFEKLTSISVSPILINWYEVSQLTKLHELRLARGNEDDDLQILTSLQKLTYLAITNNTDSIACLTKLSRLQEVHLTSNNELTCRKIAKNLPFCFILEITEK